MTAEEAVAEYRLPSTRTLRTMRQRGLPAVKIGKAYLFDAADLEQHILASKVSTCPARTAAPRSNGSASENAGTSYGTKGGASASVLLARQSAARLKKRLPVSSANDATTTNHTGRVIPLRS